MPLKGDFAELVKYRKQLDDLGDGRTINEITTKVLPKIEQLVDRQFVSASDPYGNGWAPRKADGAPALQTMRDRVTVSMQGMVIMASVEEHPGIYHQMGTARMPQRMIVPTDALGTPPQWQRVLDEVTDEVMKSKGAKKVGG